MLQTQETRRSIEPPPGSYGCSTDSSLTENAGVSASALVKYSREPLSFCRLEGDILRIPESKLPYAQKCLYARLQLRAGNSGTCYVTMAEVARWIGCDPKNVARHCEALQTFSQLEGPSSGIEFSFTKMGRAFRFSVKPFNATGKFVKLHFDMLALPKSVMPFRSVCLFGYLAAFRDCFQAHSTIGDRLGCSDRTVREAFGPLREGGLVTSLRRRRTSCRYSVCDEDVRPALVAEYALKSHKAPQTANRESVGIPRIPDKQLVLHSEKLNSSEKPVARDIENGPVFRSRSGLIFRSETDQSSAYQKSLIEEFLSDDTDLDSISAIDQKPIDTPGRFVSSSELPKEQTKLICVEEWAAHHKAVAIRKAISKVVLRELTRGQLLNVLFEARNMETEETVAAIELAVMKVADTKNAPRSAAWFASVLRNHSAHQLRNAETSSVSAIGLMSSDQVDELASAFDNCSGIEPASRKPNCTDQKTQDRRAENGESPQVSAQAASPFSAEELRKHFERGRQAFKQHPSTALQEIGVAIAELFNNLGKYAGSLEALERTLTRLDAEAVEALRRACPDPELRTMNEAVDQEFAPYLGKLKTSEIDRMKRRYIDTALLQRARLPRLSLFYMDEGQSRNRNAA